MRINYDKDYLLEVVCPHNVESDTMCVYVGSNACKCCKHCVKVTDEYVECNKIN